MPRSRMSAPARPFRAVHVAEVDVREPLPDLAVDGTYGSTLVLVRRAGTPVGTVLVDVDDETVTAHRLGAAIAADLGPIGAVGARGRGPASSDARSSEAVSARPVASVTVVVATHRRPDQLGVCVASLLSSDHGRFEVVVVDNSPDDPRTEALVRRRHGSDERVRYVDEARTGTSHARNTGIAMATGDIVAFTDDDVVVDRSWLRALTAPLERPDVACVTGLTMPYELETPAQLWFEHYGGMTNGFTPREFSLEMSDPPSLLFPFTPGVGGSNNMAIRRSVLSRSGGFDVRLGPGTPTAGGEDLDLFIRLLLGGHRIRYEPRAVVWHRHRADERSLRRHVAGYGTGAVAVLTKWFLREPALRRRVVRHLVRLPAAFGPRAERGLELGGPPPPWHLATAQAMGAMAGPLRWLQSMSGMGR